MYALSATARRGLALLWTALLLATLAVPVSALTSPARVVAADDSQACGIVPLDVEIILDQSGSMGSNITSGHSREYWAQQAAAQLVNDLDTNGGVGTGPATSTGGRHRVGLTTFNGTISSGYPGYTVRASLGSQNASAITSTINALSPSGNTPTKAGMAGGAADLTANKRTTDFGLAVRHIILFISDGRPNPDGPSSGWGNGTSQRPTLADANAFKAAADEVFSIAIGTGGSGASQVDLALMQALAKPNDSAHYANVTDGAKLPSLFSDIFSTIACKMAPDVTTQASASTVGFGGTVTDTATLTGDGKHAVTGSVTFWLCGPSANPADCTTGGTAVGSAVAVSGGTATSSAYTVGTSADASGYYCFRADYTPDTAGAAYYTVAGHTNTTTECFYVAPAQPALSLAKSASPATYSAAGSTITYTYTLTNSGQVTLSAPYAVSDDKIASVSCPSSPATLAPGAKVQCSATYSTTQADLDAGKVTNTATATAKHGGDTVTSNQASATVTAVQSPALRLTKAVTETSFSKVGDTLHYTVIATNTGNVTLHSVAVSDPLLPGLSCSPATPATLAPGAKVTCTGSYAVTQADLDAGKVDNTATATSTEAGPVEASAHVPGSQSPALSLKKAASPTQYVKAGDVIGYTYTLTNSGNVTLSAPYAVSDDKTTVSCPSGPATLAPGASVTCTASYTITQSDVDSGSVTNVATATAKHGDETVTSDKATATVTAVQTNGLALTKKADPATYDKAGDVISYTYTVTNAGNVTLYAPYAVSDDKTTVSCPSGPATLAPGASVTCTATYTITQADVDAGEVINTAIATARDSKDGTVTSNEAEAKVTADQNAKLTLVKSADPGTFSAAGDVIDYTYTLTNSGNVTLSAPYAVSDDKIASVSCPSSPATLAPGESVECTASYTITQSDVDAQSVTNTAFATANDGEITSNDDHATVDLERKPGIHIVKTASVPVLPAGGGTVTYTYSVTNTGNVPLSDVTVTDDKCAPVEYVSGDISDASSDGPSGNGLLDLNETWIFTCTATIKTTTTNVGTATGHDGESTVTATDTKTVNVGKVSPEHTLPPTSTLDAGTPGGQSPTGLLLLLVAVAGLMLVAGILVPGPAKARRRTRRS